VDVALHLIRRGRERRIARLFLILSTGVLASLALVAPRALAVNDSSGYCDPGADPPSSVCYFAQNWTLYPYNDVQTRDRGAYGYFHGDLVGAENYHPSGSTWLCAGAKTGSDGSGSNVSGMGEPCGFGTDVYAPASCPGVSGYATIINYDSATHYSFHGYGYKCH
jgi:hypothetical protein